DDQDVVAVDDDRGVTVQHGGRPCDRRVDPLCDPLEFEETYRGGAACGRMDVVGNRPDESSPGDPARGRDEPGQFQPPQHLPPAGPTMPGSAICRRMGIVRAPMMVMIRLDTVMAV